MREKRLINPRDTGGIGRVAGSVLLSAAVLSLLFAVPPLRRVGEQIVDLQLDWVLAAAALELLSCLGFVVVFRWFFDELPPGPARELAWTEEGSGALLPGGGVGAIAIGGWFLHRIGMSTRAIVDRSSALFFLTSAVNVAVLVGAGVWLAASPGVTRPDALLVAIPLGGGLAAALAVLAIPFLLRLSPRRRWPGWLRDLAAGITRAQRSLVRPSWRLLGGLAYLGFDIGALGASFAATGHPVAVAPLALGYLIGYLANLIPIPGGFGVLEGGLAGTLIAYGAPATQAAAAVVIYHAIAFWIPSVGGLAGYALLRRRLSQAPTPTAGRATGLDDHPQGESAPAEGSSTVWVRPARRLCGQSQADPGRRREHPPGCTALRADDEQRRPVV